MVDTIGLEILKRVENVIRKVDEWQIDEFISTLLKTKRVFVCGAGRSGLAGKAFAMRLMHLGFDVYVVGETTTPAIRKGDVLLAISGSGKTMSTLLIARTAKRLGATVYAITSNPKSPLAKTSDGMIVVAGRGKEIVKDYISQQLEGRHLPLTPMGTLFELSTSILLDSIIARLIKISGKEEEELRARHNNLE